MKKFTLPVFIISSLVVLHFVAICNVRRSLTAVVRDVNEKPIIYTFYDKIDPSEKHTGMTDDADNKLLQVWKEKWTEAGWDARIIDMDDAKKHPRFSEYEEKLQKVHLNGINSYYNQLCYFRWLAMAAIGGGWMSDYDVMPMNIHNHDDYFQNGKFAIYYSVEGGLGGGIPCLMSGSKLEWDRMAFSILENGLKHIDEKLWSDMFATIDLYQHHFDTYRLYDLVADVSNVEWNDDVCHLYQDKIAAHFSHSAMKTVGISDFSHRPEYAKMWVDKWKSECNAIG